MANANGPSPAHRGQAPVGPQNALRAAPRTAPLAAARRQLRRLAAAAIFNDRHIAATFDRCNMALRMAAPHFPGYIAASCGGRSGTYSLFRAAPSAVSCRWCHSSRKVVRLSVVCTADRFADCSECCIGAPGARGRYGPHPCPLSGLPPLFAEFPQTSAVWRRAGRVICRLLSRRRPIFRPPLGAAPSPGDSVAAASPPFLL